MSDGAIVSLHDCVATSLRIEGDDLLIDFPKGIWVQAIKTGAAVARLKNFEFGSVWLFRKARLPLLWHACVGTRRLLDEDDLIQKVNSGTRAFEIPYEFRCGDQRLFQCIVQPASRMRSNKPTLELCIDTPRVEYSWS